MLPSSSIHSQLGISDREHRTWEHRYTCLNSVLILTSILSPSVLAFPPNQSLVSLPASSLPPPSILVFILASQSGQTGRPLALQSIIIVVFDTYNLRQKKQKKHSLCATLLFFICPPLPPFFISIGHLFFFSQRMPDVGLIHFHSPLLLRVLPIYQSIFISLLYTPALKQTSTLHLFNNSTYLHCSSPPFSFISSYSLINSSHNSNKQ